jgi:hypothetical protein
MLSEERCRMKLSGPITRYYVKYLPGETEENYEKSQSSKTVS